jgi:hypothetical protein
MQPKSFAKQIKKENPNLNYATVALLDSDGCLCLRVTDGHGDIVAEWDTGEEGDADEAPYESKANELIAELRKLGLLVIRHDFDNDPELQFEFGLLSVTESYLDAISGEEANVTLAMAKTKLESMDGHSLLAMIETPDDDLVTDTPSFSDCDPAESYSQVKQDLDRLIGLVGGEAQVDSIPVE